MISSLLYPLSISSAHLQFFFYILSISKTTFNLIRLYFFSLTHTTLLGFYVYFYLIAPAPTVFFSVNSIPTKFSISGKDLKNVTNDKFQCLFQILHKKKMGVGWYNNPRFFDIFSRRQIS